MTCEASGQAGPVPPGLALNVAGLDHICVPFCALRGLEPTAQQRVGLM